MKVAQYIHQLQRYEEFAFSLEELIAHTTQSETAMTRELARLTEKGEIFSIRKGFYVIIPHRFRNLGRVPTELFVNKLFTYLEKPYYLAMYSAATNYGASHQKVHGDYIMTDLPKLRNIEKKNYKISFFTRKNWPPDNILQMKAEAGIFFISSPALTAVDLISHQTAMGGSYRIIEVLQELIEEVTVDDLQKLLKWYSTQSVLQRFGYLIDQYLTRPELSEMIFRKLNRKKYFWVLLSPDNSGKVVQMDKKWNVQINLNLTG